MKPRRVRDEAPVSFLSRIRGERPAAEPAPEERARRELAAVARNLEAIFNTKKGVGAVLAGFGLGDYEGYPGAEDGFNPRMGTKAILAALLPELVDQVRRFEPRLADPAVEVLGRDRELRALFAIRARLGGRPARFRLALHTVYRHVEVEAELEEEA